MAVLALPRAHDLALAQVLDFFADVRARVARDRTAPSKVRGGAVPDNLYGDTGSDGTRPLQAHPGQLHLPAHLPHDLTLVIQHTAAYTAMLPILGTKTNPFATPRTPRPGP